MPGGDRTGPMGMGPMTGRGAGVCAGFTSGGYARSGPGRGFGRGRGLGRGLGRFAGQNMNAYHPALSAQEETKVLQAQAAILQNQLKDINARMNELESGADK